jgi:hypothetical protein
LCLCVTEIPLPCCIFSVNEVEMNQSPVEHKRAHTFLF